jgi:ribonuclease HII
MQIRHEGGLIRSTPMVPLLLSNYGSGLTEAGIDEAGRGCLAGPVVAAAVILPADYHNRHLADSKQLSARKREKLRKEIEAEALSYGIAHVTAQVIDEVNIEQATFQAMHAAVSALSQLPQLLLVDGNRFIPYPFIPHVCLVKGDSLYYAIAAASVLAKTYRDEYMIQAASQYPVYGWERNFAYPTLDHRKAIALHGLCPLHRQSFRVSPPVEKTEGT